MRKREKVKTTIEVFIFDLPFLLNFRLNWKFWFFGRNLSKNRISILKWLKSTPPLNSACSNEFRYQIFSLNWQFWLFLTKLAKKMIFLFKNGRIPLARASMIVTYCIKLLRTRADRCKCILNSLLLLVAETIRDGSSHDVFNIVFSV